LLAICLFDFGLQIEATEIVTKEQPRLLYARALYVVSRRAGAGVSKAQVVAQLGRDSFQRFSGESAEVGKLRCAIASVVQTEAGCRGDRKPFGGRDRRAQLL